MTGGAEDSPFSHRYTAPWSEVRASSNQERHSRRRSWSSARSAARTLPVSVVRRRRNDASGASPSCEPPKATPERRPRLLYPVRHRLYALRQSPQPAEYVPEGALGRLDARQRACERSPGVPALLGAEAHLSQQLVRTLAAGEVRGGQRERGPSRERVGGDVLAGQGEEGFFRGRGPESPGPVHIPGG